MSPLIVSVVNSPTEKMLPLKLPLPPISEPPIRDGWLAVDRGRLLDQGDLVAGVDREVRLRPQGGRRAGQVPQPEVDGGDELSVPAVAVEKPVIALENA